MEEHATRTNAACNQGLLTVETNGLQGLLKVETNAAWERSGGVSTGSVVCGNLRQRPGAAAAGQPERAGLPGAGTAGRTSAS